MHFVWALKSYKMTLMWHLCFSKAYPGILASSHHQKYKCVYFFCIIDSFERQELCVGL